MIIGILMLVYLLFSLISFLAFSSERKPILFISYGLGLGALLVHGYWLIARGVQAERWPFINTYETLILLSFLMIAIYFLTLTRERISAIGGFVGLIASVLLALSSLLSSEIEPLIPSLKSNWLFFHVVSSFIGYAALGLACASAIAYLVVDFVPLIFRVQPELKSGKPEFLNGLSCRFVRIGFAFLTLGIATGAVWANATWGSYWNWDPKETWAFITWLIFGVHQHMQREAGKHTRSMAFCALIGFATVIFTYFGVNFWMPSLHTF